MIFRNNSELVSAHIHNLFMDGYIHTAREVLDYIQEKTGGVGISGSPIGRSTIDNALKTMRNSTMEIESIGRGHYKITPIGLNSTRYPVMKSHENRPRIGFQLCSILERAQKEVKSALSLQMDSKDISEDAMLLFFRLNKRLIEGLEQYKQEVNEMLPTEGAPNQVMAEYPPDSQEQEEHPAESQEQGGMCMTM